MKPAQGREDAARVHLLGDSVRFGWKGALCLAAIVAVGFWMAAKFGQMTGADAGARAKDRSELVWPSLMTMADDDRALIVGLAMSCHVERREATPRDVIACLREAAIDADAILPKGVDGAHARTRLEQLLPRQFPMFDKERQAGGASFAPDIA